MSTSTLGGSFLDPIATSQESFTLPDGVLLERYPLKGCAPKGAQPSSPELHCCDDGQVERSALLAGAMFSTNPSAILFYENLFITDPLITSPGIATLARRDQIFGDVVESIEIDVIGNEIPGTGNQSCMPRDFRATPVTCMDSGTYLVKENHAMLLDSSVSAGQRMSVPVIQNSIFDPIVLIGLDAITSSHSKDPIIGV